MCYNIIVSKEKNLQKGDIYMNNYLEQFKTEEEVEREMKKLKEENEKKGKNVFDLELMKKINSLNRYKDYLKEKKIAEAIAKLRAKRG